jgi:hypothetical protein
MNRKRSSWTGYTTINNNRGFRPLPRPLSALIELTRIWIDGDQSCPSPAALDSMPCHASHGLPPIPTNPTV